MEGAVPCRQSWPAPAENASPPPPTCRGSKCRVLPVVVHFAFPQRLLSPCPRWPPTPGACGIRPAVDLTRVTPVPDALLAAWPYAGRRARHARNLRIMVGLAVTFVRWRSCSSWSMPSSCRCFASQHPPRWRLGARYGTRRGVFPCSGTSGGGRRGSRTARPGGIALEPSSGSSVPQRRRWRQPGRRFCLDRDRGPGIEPRGGSSPPGVPAATANQPTSSPAAAGPPRSTRECCLDG